MVYPRLHVIKTNLLPQLLAKERLDKKSCEVVCPECWNPDAFHYFGTGSINCNHCNTETDIIQALQSISEISENEAIEKVLSAVGLALPSNLQDRLTLQEANSESSNANDLRSEQRTTYLDRKWLLKQLRIWLSNSPKSLDQLIKAGWTEDLVRKAPVGFLPSTSELESLSEHKLPKNLYKSSLGVSGGIVVPWFVHKDDAILWGYSGNIMESEPNAYKLEISIPACHLHHPIHKRFDWMVIVEDPLLASLLIGRQIPAVATGPEAWWNKTVYSLKTVKKDLYVLDSPKGKLHKRLSNVVPKIKKTSPANPLAFGPYHGAYYRRFTKWPHSRYKELDAIVYSESEVIAELVKHLDSGISFDSAVSQVLNETGKKVEITDLRNVDFG
ncbi:hypothetical protein BCT46_14835 [Vibrio sp. 10N.261.46.E8]|nr:hypothetical protein BH584_15285 [Vibrio sp. 10N.261.45.E1]PMJ27834.1 hypothetical protein BCU27_06490 [Vibrio sp. 10N.286.45.B6]PML88107.1 hypothetical protein BCT66_10950 [Vibrio sp. 10N.261.49.E11]PMM67435.1 hypothetical protein BCT48_15425 [Vibrio sp. 10N.261.46.F12]PMM81682.1 hypothetical protein BCT46_14835 [Vibrio sp. 10N.261.46.E8]PMN77950.1 hypothetical protein BCT22_20490 [Vibrio sp. 10N.261.45.A1]PMN91910.1 hypothetical protein BCT25_00785 [Vibrio sp. 10N.261.45.A6]